MDVPSFVLFKGQEGRLQVWAKSKPYVDLDAHEMTVAEWSYAHGEMAGAGTQTLSNVSTFFVPMKSLEETVGVIGIRYEYKNLLLDQTTSPCGYIESVSAGSSPMGNRVVPICLQAYTFVALRPVLTRRTVRYACVAQASERLGLHLESKSV